MEPLEIVRTVLVILHLLGLAVIIGAFVLQVRKRTDIDFGAMIVAAVVQLATGLALVGVREAGDLPLDHVKVAVKLVLAVAVLVLVLVGRRAKKPLPFLHAAGAAAIANVVIAVAWQ